MKNKEFTIPFLGLKEKVYHFEYELKESFFDTIAEPIVIEPDIKVELKFDKRHEPYVLDFIISGTYRGECDRCAANIIIPIEGEFRLFVEIGNEENREDETEVIYISREAFELDLYEHIYDFVHLTIPMVKRCESSKDIKECNKRVKEFLNKINAKNKDEDPRWEALKKLKQ